MRILILSHGYPPTISGVTIVVQKIARAMVRRGHSVRVITASENHEPYRVEDQGVDIVRVRSAPNPFWSEGPLPILPKDKLEQLTSAFSPDVINTHEGALLSMQLIRLEKQLGIPQILTCHYLPRFATHFLKWGDLVEELVENVTWEYSIRMINQFDHVTFPTESQQEEFIKEGLKVPSTVISNGVDSSRYHPGPDDRKGFEEMYHLPSGPRILFVGRLARDKKIDLLIRAMPEIWEKESAHLLIVGRGDHRTRLQTFTKNLGLEECVHFLGFVPEEDLPSLYRRVDLFTIASDTEVQSIPTLQAVVTGLPVVAVDAGALPELVQEGKNGYLVPPDDEELLKEAFLQIIRDPDLAKRFGEASLKIGDNHQNEHTFASYENLYQTLMKSHTYATP
jgi:glycosyltransferase involved in cell wall biosynthesis